MLCLLTNLKRFAAVAFSSCWDKKKCGRGLKLQTEKAKEGQKIEERFERQINTVTAMFKAGNFGKLSGMEHLLVLLTGS